MHNFLLFDRYYVRLLDGITDAMDMNLGKFREMVREREAWRAAVHGVAKSQAWLGGWMTCGICFLGGSVITNLPANAGDMGGMGWIPGLGWSPEEEMATHSSVL